MVWMVHVSYCSTQSIISIYTLLITEAGYGYLYVSYRLSISSCLIVLTIFIDIY